MYPIKYYKIIIFFIIFPNPPPLLFNLSYATLCLSLTFFLSTTNREEAAPADSHFNKLHQKIHTNTNFNLYSAIVIQPQQTQPSIHAQA